MRGWAGLVPDDRTPRDASSTYEEHREVLFAAHVPLALAISFGTTVFYTLARLVRDDTVAQVLSAPTLSQLAIPLVGYLLIRGPFRARPILVALLTDLAFTAAIAAHLLLPITTLSGIALFLSLKMLATALYFPWGTRVQASSALFTVLLYYAAVWLGDRVVDLTGPGTHQLLGPVIGAVLSVGGAARADRIRRNLFTRERELEQEAEVASALARVGQALISSLDKEAVVERLCEVTTEVLDCDCSHTVLWDPHQSAFLPVASHGYPQSQWEAFKVLKIDPATLGDSFRPMRENGIGQIRVRDLSDPGWRCLALELGLEVSLGVALVRGDELIGFHAAVRRRDELFTPTQLRIAAGMGRIAALALENLRLVEELESGSRVKSEFVATISHELRSPLNVILGYSDLLLSGGFGTLSSEQNESVRRIERSGHELHELITATLDLSRIEAGTVDLDVSDVSVDALIDQLDAETRETRDKDGLRFAWQIAEGLPVLHTDPLKLKVVLKNLVTNAVKFTEQGSVSVEADPRDDGVEFRVVDTGIGIAPEALSRIFDAFRQENHPATGRRAGVGLGLYIVRRLVDLLGGQIGVESIVGQGSTFRVWIPCDREERVAASGELGADQAVA